MRDRLLFAGTILWLLAFSVALTLFLAIPLFYAEIPLEHLSQAVPLSPELLRHNFDILMNYLLNPLVSQLQMPNFPSSADGLQHFREVKQLFMLTFALVFLLLPALIFFVKENLNILFHNGLRLLMLLPVLLGITATLIGFDNFFILFHQVLFRDNTWMFDPLTDPIINVLPDNYFMWSFIVFVVVFELSCLMLYRHAYRAKIKK